MVNLYYSACIITVSTKEKNLGVIVVEYNIRVRILSVPISSNEGTEFIIVGVDPILLFL